MPSSTMPPKKRRSTNFSERELQSLLDTIESILPIGSGEWDRVMIEHSIDFQEQHRTMESLRRKFRDLHLKKAPTGDPNMPATVRRAKEINLLIRQKSLVCIDCNETEEEDEEEEKEEEGEDVRDAAVAARATAFASIPLLSDRREAEGNAVAQTATAVGLSRRGKRGRTAATPMESYMALLHRHSAHVSIHSSTLPVTRDRLHIQ